MWGFLRVENEHISIYGGVSATGSDLDTLGEHLLVSSASSPSASTVVSSSLSGSGPVSDSGNAWEPRAERHVGSINRGTGLDKLPYARMDIASNGGVVRRATSPLKAWCLHRVRQS